jgi:hypothetical protein
MFRDALRSPAPHSPGLAGASGTMPKPEQGFHLPHATQAVVI